MAKRVKPSKTKVAQLGRTPRRTEQVIAGGIRPLVGAANADHAADAPLIAIWLDSATGAVRAAKPIKPGLPQDEMWGEALDTLADACIAPVPGPFSGGASDDEYATTNGMLFSLPMPYLPGKILVNDEGLAQAAHAIFDPLGVPIEYSASLPGFDAAYASLTSFMGLDEEPPEPFAWHVDEVLLQPLYAAARKYWQAAPWEMLPDHPPVEVALGELGPERGVETLYGAIIGAGGEAFGVALYYSLDDYLESLERGAELSANDADVDEMIEMLRQSGAPVDGLPPEVLRGAVGSLMGRMDAKSEGAADSADDEDDDLDDAHLPDNIALIFMEARETDPTYLDWLKARGLKYPSRKAVPQFLRVSPDHDPRALTNREAQAMMLSVEAITAFTQIMAPVFTQGMMPAEPLTLPISVKEGDQTRTIRVTFPPPGRDWSEDFATVDEEVEEPERPATEAGRATLYRFKV
ncbi:MAG TPA: hypothetical protein VJR48_09100, partial [Ktedonobacterales bacterium]|nr:hypothetical protein [Ktedonobacterales bacterium]